LAAVHALRWSSILLRRFPHTIEGSALEASVVLFSICRSFPSLCGLPSHYLLYLNIYRLFLRSAPRMQASAFLKCMRTSLARSANSLQSTALSRFPVRAVPRSFIAHGFAEPTIRSALQPPPLTRVAVAAPDSRQAATAQDCKSFTVPSSTVSITLRPDGVTVHRHDQTAFVPLRWLRDHCTSPAVYDAKTNSRLSPIPLSVDEWVPVDIAVDSLDASLCITWRDGRRSSFSADWLAATVLPPQHASHVAPDDFLNERPVPWEGKTPSRSSVASFSEENFPTVPNSALARPAGVLRACSYLHRFGAVFIDELEASEAATRAMIERFGVLRNSMFGSFWTFEANGAMDDLA
jgi:hypothetical protein